MAMSWPTAPEAGSTLIHIQLDGAVEIVSHDDVASSPRGTDLPSVAIAGIRGDLGERGLADSKNHDLKQKEGVIN